MDLSDRALIAQARKALREFPQLDQIIACYEAGENDPCEFCHSAGHAHSGAPMPVPEVFLKARENRDKLTRALPQLTACAEAAELAEELRLSAAPVPAPRRNEFRVPHPMLSNRRTRDGLKLEGHRRGWDGSALPTPVPPPKPSVKRRPRRGRRFR